MSHKDRCKAVHPDAGQCEIHQHGHRGLHVRCDGDGRLEWSTDDPRETERSLRQKIRHLEGRLAEKNKAIARLERELADERTYCQNLPGVERDDIGALADEVISRLADESEDEDDARVRIVEALLRVRDATCKVRDEQVTETKAENERLRDALQYFAGRKKKTQHPVYQAWIDGPGDVSLDQAITEHALAAGKEGNDA